MGKSPEPEPEPEPRADRDAERFRSRCEQLAGIVGWTPQEVSEAVAGKDPARKRRLVVELGVRRYGTDGEVMMPAKLRKFREDYAADIAAFEDVASRDPLVVGLAASLRAPDP